MPAHEAHDRWRVLHELRRSPELFRAIRAQSGSELHVQKELRRQFPEECVRAALSLVELRRAAREKFSRAEEMWFERTGLQQATSEAVARHKAQRFEGLVWDACAGIGGDALPLAARGECLAVDLSPVNCLCCRWNAEAYGVGERLQVVCANIERQTDRSGLLHVDPDRRAGGRGRTLRLERMRPALDRIERWMDEFRGGAIKLSPASNFPGKFPGAEIELVSLHGECKEATVWFGDLAEPGLWRATRLPGGETIAGDPLSVASDVRPLGRFVYDPDPAVVRAGLVDVMAERFDLSRLDEAEEYLTSEEFRLCPFARAFEVVAEMPAGERAVRRYFQAGHFARVEIKSRHLPIAVDALRRKLSLEGEAAAVLIFARLGGRARALHCRRV